MEEHMSIPRTPLLGRIVAFGCLLVAAGCADSTIPDLPMNEVRGHTSDASGAPIAAEVTLTILDPHSSFVPVTVRSDAAGGFVIRTRGTGPHRLWARATPWLAGVIDLEPPATGLELRLGPTGCFEGRALRAAMSDHSGIQVGVYGAPEGIKVQTDVEGVYRLGGIPPGHWQLGVADARTVPGGVEFVIDTFQVVMPSPPDTVSVADVVFAARSTSTPH
jgi:hypothetical protein